MIKHIAAKGNSIDKSITMGDDTKQIITLYIN